MAWLTTSCIQAPSPIVAVGVLLLLAVFLSGELLKRELTHKYLYSPTPGAHEERSVRIIRLAKKFFDKRFAPSVWVNDVVGELSFQRLW